MRATTSLVVLSLAGPTYGFAFSARTVHTGSSKSYRHSGDSIIRQRRRSRPFHHRLFVSSTSPPTQQEGLSSTDTVVDDPYLQVDIAAPADDVLFGRKFLEKSLGTIPDDRFNLLPEYSSGEVSRLFSSLTYDAAGRARHAAGSVAGAAALVAGTTIGAGVLALPTATAAAGFLPSSFALLSAYVYMTMSGLLIAELTMNHIGKTGRPGIGLLELYKTSLSGPLNAVGSVAYFFLHYAVMVAYFAQGGLNVDGLLEAVGAGGLLADVPGAGPVAFAALCGLALFAAPPALVEKANNAMVLGVGASFLAIVAIGAQTADFGSLIDPANQHPAEVVNCLPILFLALVYQNIVPTVVTQLEGDRSKIMTAIVAGTTAPLLMFLAWNAVVLGNVAGAGADLSGLDPVAALQQQGAAAAGGAAPLLGPLVGAFSSLALTTSVIGFTYGLLDAWTDVFRISPQSLAAENRNLKAPLFGLVFGPPLALSLLNPDIFYSALEYGGAFGVSVLFLFLPPIMVWGERYGAQNKPLVVKPMVPFGKLALGSMYKIAATLVLEQGAEKLGVFDFFREHFLT